MVLWILEVLLVLGGSRVLRSKGSKGSTVLRVLRVPWVLRVFMGARASRFLWVVEVV